MLRSSDIGDDSSIAQALSAAPGRSPAHRTRCLASAHPDEACARHS